ncbi:MAG: pyridoxamine 5'-phosphate oxidase family protein, partial [Chloroflexota bacterium]
MQCEHREAGNATFCPDCGLRMCQSPVGDAAARFAERQRVARLATADRSARPHVVPVCFALE